MCESKPRFVLYYIHTILRARVYLESVRLHPAGAALYPRTTRTSYAYGLRDNGQRTTRTHVKALKLKADARHTCCHGELFWGGRIARHTSPSVDPLETARRHSLRNRMPYQH
jgi:hypothetical protein